MLRVYLAALLLLLSASTQAAAASGRIVLYSVKSLVTARIDPLISPGKVSQHSHIIVGSSAFSQTYDPDKIRQGKCSNLGVHADLSNYWAPQVFRVLSNGSYTAMKTQTRVYYQSPETLPGVEVEPFPYDFRMIAGDPARKTMAYQSQADMATFYYCERKSGGQTTSFESYTLPTVHCDVAKVIFPTCWNGQKFDISNPHAHVRYPSWGGGMWGARCPAGFERRIPSILLETFYFNTVKTNPKQRQFILANGDTLGYGQHGDFQNGWDQDVLRGMLRDCQNPPVEEPANMACPALAPSYDQQKAFDCRYEGKIPDEPIGASGPLRYLPGCNLPWTPDMKEKPSCNPKIYKGDPKFVTPPSSLVWP